MRHVFALMSLIVLVCLLIACACGRAGAEPPMVPERPGAWVNRDSTAAEPATVVYGAIQKGFADLQPGTRYLRVLVCYGRTEFFVADGMPRGFEYELLMEYQGFLNQKRKRGLPKVKLVFIPVRFGELLPGLLAGRGDIAAGLISATEERKRSVAFSAPYVTGVREVVVANSKTEQPSRLEDLSGKKVHVLDGSSFIGHLKELNGRLSAMGRPLADIQVLPPNVDMESLLGMLNAGIVQYSILDGFMAEFWGQVYPELWVSKNFCLSEGQDIAWAVRKDNPELQKSLNAFVATMNSDGVAKCAALHKQYFKNARYVKNPLGLEASYRTGQLCPYFKDASGKNELDWLMMMAQGFQESGLIQEMRGPTGAVGIMQVMPETAKGLGFSDVYSARANITAGVTYMRHIREQYFDDEALSADAKLYFTLAAYNAGPNRVQRLRKLAADRGLDPNVWFNNVERVALDKVGEEVVRYVENILCYYLAYKMSYMMMETSGAKAVVGGE